MFIWNARHTHRHAVSRIEEVEADCGPDGDCEGYSKIFLEGGGDALVRTADIDGIGDSIVGVIPSPAGYNILHAGLTDLGKGYVYRAAPVVGFAVAANGETRPITARGVHDSMYRAMPIEHPDGFVWDEAVECGYDSREAFLLEWATELLARVESDRERAAQAPTS